MRIHSAAHNGSIPGCAMYNKALLCSIWLALRKPLRNLVIERGGVVENVVIANCVFFFFFPVVHAPFEKWISWPRTNAASQTSTCFSAPLWETEGYFSKSYLIKACDFSSPTLLFLFAVCYWQAFLFDWGGCSGEWQSLVRHVGRHVSIESHNAVHFTEFFFPV